MNTGGNPSRNWRIAANVLAVNTDAGKSLSRYTLSWYFANVVSRDRLDDTIWRRGYPLIVRVFSASRLTPPTGWPLFQYPGGAWA
jgi:hypothetical protein